MTTTEELPTLLDVNVLLALVWDHHIHHGSAHRHFRAVASDFATSPVTEIGLVRLLLTPSVTGRAVSPAEALGTLNALRTQPGWHFLPDNASFANPLVVIRVLGGRRQVTDLHLVNLCAAHGHRLATFDAGIEQILAPQDRAHVLTWR